MLKIFVKSILTVIGIAFGLFCLLLANHGAIRLYGWSQTGRFAPPSYPGLEKFDVVTFAAEPMRALLEIGGSVFLIAISLCGIAVVYFIFRRGLNNLPFVLPMAFVLVLSVTLASVFTGHIDWLLPVSTLLGLIAIGIDWISLRRKGLPITARFSDVYPVSQQTGPAQPRQPAWLGLATAALFALLAVMKIMDIFRS